MLLYNYWNINLMVLVTTGKHLRYLNECNREILMKTCKQEFNTVCRLGKPHTCYHQVRSCVDLSVIYYLI